jgi:hypothetical protein
LRILDLDDRCERAITARALGSVPPCQILLPDDPVGR